MSRRKLWVIAGCVGVAVLAAVWFCLPSILFVISLERAIAERTNRALHETDHARLLDVCREMMKDPERFRAGLPSELLEVRPDQWPEPIRRLQPLCVLLDNLTCRVTMTGGFHSSAVVAFPGDPKEPDELVTFKLRPGLWFYEEGPIRGVMYPPGYPKR